MSNSNSTTQHQFTQHIVCEYKTVAVPTSKNVIVVVVVVALTCMQFHIGITQHLFNLKLSLLGTVSLCLCPYLERFNVTLRGEQQYMQTLGLYCICVHYIIHLQLHAHTHTFLNTLRISVCECTSAHVVDIRMGGCVCVLKEI